MQIFLYKYNVLNKIQNSICVHTNTKLFLVKQIISNN